MILAVLDAVKGVEVGQQIPDCCTDTGHVYQNGVVVEVVEHRIDLAEEDRVSCYVLVARLCLDNSSVDLRIGSRRLQLRDQCIAPG